MIGNPQTNISILTAGIFLSLFVLVALLASALSVIGYLITIVCVAALASVIVCILLSVDDIASVLKGRVNRYSIVILIGILIFFLLFSTIFLKGNELIFFDENIYQSIALNVVHHGNALTCLYGTSQLKSCYAEGLGYDPNGWPVLIAIAFALFGARTSTAYGLELLIGALSVVFVFILASMASVRREVPVLAAAAFSMIPELFIWSRTPANPSLPFMALVTLSSCMFLLFIYRPGKRTLTLLLSSVVLSTYVRVEALVLLPVFLLVMLLYWGGSRAKTVKRAAISLARGFLKSTDYVIISCVFLLALMPEAYASIYTKHLFIINATPFGATHGLFSIYYLVANTLHNGAFLLGGYSFYPIVFLPAITVFALIGIVSIVRKKNPALPPAHVLLILLLVFYFIFYAAYFSGSALLGTSVRFMLVLYPSISILAALGICWIGDAVSSLFSQKRKPTKNPALLYAVFAVVIAIFFAIPFLYAAPAFTHVNYNYPDEPLMLNSTTQNSPYLMVYANRSLAFIEDNYSSVPSDCLVFSEEPYLWYSLNRSSVSMGLINISQARADGYGCYVLDYDFWCTVSPDNSTACSPFAHEYVLQTIATQRSGDETNFSLYRIVNYSSPK